MPGFYPVQGRDWLYSYHALVDWDEILVRVLGILPYWFRAFTENDKTKINLKFP